LGFVVRQAFFGGVESEESHEKLLSSGVPSRGS
jgi:hypothetical protein